MDLLNSVPYSSGFQITFEYVDGGFDANNPCAEIYEEVRRMNNNSRRCVSMILSIDNGKKIEARRFKGTGFHRYLNKGAEGRSSGDYLGRGLQIIWADLKATAMGADSETLT